MKNNKTFLPNTKTILIKTFIVLLLVQFYSCNTTEPPDNGGDNKADTTSHDFAWETNTFGGEVGSSILYDVAIIDENNIWAVGEIYTADEKYNAVHWDGSEWEMKKILYYGDCSAVMYPPLKAIYAFTEQNIVLTNGGSIGWFDGNAVNLDCRINPFLTGAINAMWGTSSSDFYVVGNGGNIAHYDGSSWLKIESGTELNIQDIYGSINTNNGEVEILCIASDKYQNNGYSLINIVDNTAGKLTATELPWSLSSIWFIPGKKYYLGGDGLYIANNPESAWQKEAKFPTYYKDRIRGIGYNDIVVSGSNGLLSHYNGNTWKHYMDEELPYIVGRYSSVNIKGDIIVSVGYRDREAIIVLGKR